MFDEKIIIQKLNSLYHNGEFDSYRVYFRKVRDRQPFFSSNVISILNKCDFTDEQLIKNIKESKLTLQTYQKGHLSFHWPLTNEKSRIANSKFLSKLELLTLSPDADCTCLINIAKQQYNLINDIVDELSYYRADNKKFILPEFQKNLTGTENTFLTWFPPKKNCIKEKLETIDISVDSNILWFLGEYKCLNIPGAGETINFIRKILSTDLIIKKPFELSPYYPFPLIILYHISRAIFWGKISDLCSSKNQILKLANQIKPKSSLDYLLLASIGCFVKNTDLLKYNLSKLFKNGIKYSPIYVWPLLFPAAQHSKRLLWLAKLKFTHIKFYSESFQWAILLWILQETQNEGLPIN